MNRSKPSRSASASSRSRSRQQGGFPWWLVAVGVVVLLGAIVVATAATGDDPKSARELGVVDVSGTPLATFDPTVPDPAVGAVAPTLHGVDFDGESVVIGPGRATMIVFMAHWCPHCNREAPRLRSWIDGGGVPGHVDVIIVPTGSSSTAPNWPPSDWLRTQGLDEVPVLVDDEATTAAGAFGLDGYPYVVTLDANAQVVERRSGEQPEGAFAAMADRLPAPAE